MLKELLEKRTSEYELATKEILELFQEKLVKALRLYMKTEKDIRLSEIEYYKPNSNFVELAFSTVLVVGDRIKLPDGTLHLMTQENIHAFQSNQIAIILPVKVIDEADGHGLCKYIRDTDEFVNQYGLESYHKYLATGIEQLGEITYESDVAQTLDQASNPIEAILEEFDELQKLQYMVFSKGMQKVLN